MAKRKKSVNPQINALLNQSMEQHRAGQLPAAEAGYRQVLSADPDNADALHLLGLLAQQVGNLDVASQLISRACKLRPKEAGFHYNYGCVLQSIGDLDGAAKAYRVAIRCKPAYREALENLGVVLTDLGALRDARTVYQNVIKISDHSALARHNLGTVERDLGDFTKADTHFSRSLEIDPVYTSAHLKYAQTRLAASDFDVGFKELEWRRYSEDLSPRALLKLRPVPIWPGLGIPPGKILITAEQGIGDEIMFASCFSDLQPISEACTIECEPRLLGLFSRAFPNMRCIPSTMTVDEMHRYGPFDWRLPAGSLPRHFRKQLKDFPQQPGYLFADDAMREIWRKRLAALPNKLNVGLSWRGGLISEHRDVAAAVRQKHSRAINLKDFQFLFEDRDCNIINLQYGDHSEEIASSGLALQCFPDIDPLRDMDEFAALIAELDLVISIDNSTVHLAGALNVPTLVLLPASSEWRWFGNEKTDSPWYPSLRLFHKDVTSAWAEPLGRIAKIVQSLSPTERTDVTPSEPCKSVTLSEEGTRALLLNDTSNWYDWGCSCTSIALHQQLSKHYSRVDSIAIQRTNPLSGIQHSQADFSCQRVFDAFREAHADVIDRMHSADAVIINGEGTIHGDGPAATGLLYLAWIAKTRLGKRVEIINHSCYPAKSSEALYQMVYSAVDVVAIREPSSLREMQGLGIHARPAFDCLPLFADTVMPAAPDRLDNVVTLAGSVEQSTNFLSQMADLVLYLRDNDYQVRFLLGAACSHAADDFAFASALHRKTGGCFDVLNSSSEYEWLKTIAESSLLVSGRFHHSIAAAWFGTPMLVLRSNTAKISGLLERLGLDQQVSSDDSLDLVAETQQVLCDKHATTISDAKRDELRELALANFYTDD